MSLHFDRAKAKYTNNEIISNMYSKPMASHEVLRLVFRFQVFKKESKQQQCETGLKMNLFINMIYRVNQK